MDLLIIAIVLLVLFGGGGALYWGMGLGWGIGPIGLILAVLAISALLLGYRGRKGGGSHGPSWIKALAAERTEASSALRRESTRATGQLPGDAGKTR